MTQPHPPSAFKAHHRRLFAMVAWAVLLFQLLAVPLSARHWADRLAQASTGFWSVCSATHGVVDAGTESGAADWLGSDAPRPDAAPSALTCPLCVALLSPGVLHMHGPHVQEVAPLETHAQPPQLAVMRPLPLPLRDTPPRAPPSSSPDLT